MVDVRAAAGRAPIVQDQHVRTTLAQERGEGLLTRGTGGPGLRMLWVRRSFLAPAPAVPGSKSSSTVIGEDVSARKPELTTDITRRRARGRDQVIVSSVRSTTLK